jgi:hypothetical protein
MRPARFAAAYLADIFSMVNFCFHFMINERLKEHRVNPEIIWAVSLLAVKNPG